MNYKKKLLSSAVLFGVTVTAHATNCEDIRNALSINPPSIRFDHVQNNSAVPSFSAEITLTNKSNISLNKFTLYFNKTRPVQTVTEPSVTLLHQQGDYFGLQFSNPLAAGESIHVPIQGQDVVSHEDDAPAGYFMVTWDDQGQVCPAINIKKSQISNTVPDYIGMNDYNNNIAKTKAIIEGHASTATVFASPTNVILPKPNYVSVPQGAADFTLNTATRIVVIGNDGAMQQVAQNLQQQLQKEGYALSIVTLSFLDSAKINNAIILQETKLNVNSTMLAKQSEAYTLDVNVAPQNLQVLNHNVIFIGANVGDSHALFDGVQSLVQLFSAGKKTIPALHIFDYPRFAYRGILLDSVRHFIPVSQIKHLIDLMALSKLNYLEWHLTDDEAWRLPMTGAYAILTEKGAARGYDLTLQATLGSGGLPYGEAYSEFDIADVTAYANAHHITIIPEIEMPGHARALTQIMPETFVDANDQSRYQSPQYYSDNVLNPCLANSGAALQNILQQVSRLFPNAPYISVGGDEVPTGAWMASPACKAFMQQHGLTTEQEVENYFFASMIQPNIGEGKKMAGWQDLIESATIKKGNSKVNQGINNSALIFIWKPQNVAQLTINATKLGYHVVLAPATNLYFDLAYSADPHEPGSYWAGYVDTFAAYNFMPIPPDVAQQADVSKIDGVEGTLWSEHITDNAHMEYLAFPKIAALAELAWTAPQLRDWNDFSYRLSRYFLPILDRLEVVYRISPPGTTVMAGKVYANVEFTTQVVDKKGMVVSDYNPEYQIYYDTGSLQHQTYNVNNPPNYVEGMRFYTCIPTGRCSYKVAVAVGA